MTTVRTDRSLRRIGTDLAAGANRLLQVAIAVGLSAGLRRRDPSVIVNGVLSLLFASLPAWLERRYGAAFRPWQRLWVSAAALVHTLGMLGPYDRIWWWDHLAHTLSGVVVAAAADVVYRKEGAGRPTVSGRSRSTVIVAITMGFGLLWEVLEYVVHSVADRLGFDPLLVHYGRLDAVGDLVFDALGAAIVIRYGRGRLSNVVESITDD